MSDSDRESEPLCSLPAFLTEDQEQQDANTLYKYRDFGQVQEDDEDVTDIPPSTPSSRGSSESSIRVQKFPVKLYAILAQKEFHDIICWMPHGRSWKVLKPTMFESLVMPLFFEYSNYHSFNRLVNAWSFRRISSGPDRGSYYHELFLRGKPFLQKYMRRLPKTHKKLPMRKKDEPDFYKLDKTSVLPALEDAPVPGAAATTLAIRQHQQHPHVQVSMRTHQHSPISSIVTPPHMSPSLLNLNGHGQSGMDNNSLGGQNSGFMEGSASMGLCDPIVSNSGTGSNCGLGSSGMGINGLGGLGGMGQSGHLGMNQGRLQSGNHIGGPHLPRFNGYNPPLDSFELQDEYDLQPGLGGSRIGYGLSQNNLQLNSGSNYDGMNPSFGNGIGYSDGMGNEPVRYGGSQQSQVNMASLRRPASMLQSFSALDQLPGGNCIDGLSGTNALSMNSHQDIFSPSYSQQLNSQQQLQSRNNSQQQRSFQFQQFQGEASNSSLMSSQHLNNMPLHMQQIYNRGMENGIHDDYISAGLRRTMPRS